MREDDEIGHYVRLLRRMIIPFAVIIAVPVILWTITAFILYQIGLPKVSTFPNTLATLQQSTPRQAKLADPQEAEVTTEGSLLVEHPPDAPQSAPSAAQVADTLGALGAISNSATPMVAKGAGSLPPFAANAGATAGTAGAMQPADVLSSSAPLSGPIQLPRPRPHDAGTVRKADTMLSRVPMPRPRPAADGSGAQQETTNR